MITKAESCQFWAINKILVFKNATYWNCDCRFWWRKKIGSLFLNFFCSFISHLMIAMKTCSHSQVIKNKQALEFRQSSLFCFHWRSIDCSFCLIDLNLMQCTSIETESDCGKNCHYRQENIQARLFSAVAPIFITIAVHGRCEAGESIFVAWFCLSTWSTIVSYVSAETGDPNLFSTNWNSNILCYFVCFMMVQGQFFTCLFQLSADNWNSFVWFNQAFTCCLWTLDQRMIIGNEFIATFCRVETATLVAFQRVNI